MVAVALILLVLVAVLTLGIVVSNPDVYDLSIFGAVVHVSSAGIFLTGAIAMALTVVALLMLQVGIRRSRARRKQIKALQASSDKVSSPEPDSTTSKTSETSTASDFATTEAASTTKEKSSLELDGESSTTAAERQAMVDEGEAITRDEPQK
jgi:hypothetical protein